jgi:hypothetical protein
VLPQLIDFLQFEYDMAMGFFFSLFLKSVSYLVFCDLPESVVWCLTLIWGKFLVTIASNSSIPFFLILQYACIIPFVVVSKFLDILFCFFFLPVFFLFAFSIGGFY